MPNIIKPLGGLTTSAQLAAALSDETGTGLAVFSTSPAFTTQISTPKIVTASGILEILPAGNAHVVLQGSGGGNVGIGTTGPSEILHVAGGTLSTIRNEMSEWLSNNATNGETDWLQNAYYSSGFKYRLADEASRIQQANGIITFSSVAAGSANAAITWVDNVTVLQSGNVGIGVTAPTAAIHLPAGTTVANTAPLKFTSGFLLTTTEAGAIEFLTDAYYATITTGAGTAAARKTIAFLESPAFTTQISTPKIVTASGNLEILPAGNANIILQGSGTGNVGIGITVPTAVLHLKAGTATANTAPLQFTSGPVETTPRAGLVEYDGVLTFTAADALRTPLNKQYVLASKIGANFNVTTDQSITIPAGRWIIRKIVVNNASISLTTAAGGLYTGASKTGTTIVGAGQVYTALTASGKFLDLTLDAAMATDILTATTIYFSLTTAQGAAATGDIFIIGDRLDY